MKKRILSVVILTLLVVALSVVTAAVGVTYSIGETAKPGMYQIVATISDETGNEFMMFTNDIHFDSNIILPALPNGNTANLGNAAQAKATAIPYSWTEMGYNEETWEEEEITRKADLQTVTYTIDGANSVLKFEELVNPSMGYTPGSANDKVVFAMNFKLADGKTLDDVAITVDEILYNNGNEYFNAIEGVEDTEGFVINNTLAPKTPAAPEANIPTDSGVAADAKYENGIKFTSDFSEYEATEGATEYGFVVSADTALGIQKAPGADNKAKLVKENDGNGVIAKGVADFNADLVAVVYNIDDADATIYIRPYIVINSAAIYGPIKTTTLGAING